jgi:hemolysin D
MATAAAGSIESLTAGIAQSEKRIAQTTSNYRQQLQNERVEAAGQRHRLEQELDKHQHRSGLLELKAPQAGVVKDLATHTPGTVVAPGTILLTLVPQNEPLVAEVWVGNADAGFESQGRSLPLVPGMLVNAEIHLGTRSVLEYLLSPVQKVMHEAGRER